MASKTNGNYFPILKSVLVYWKILGLCPFVLTKDTVGRLSYGGIIYTTIIALAYCFLYYCAVVNRLNYVMIQETPMTVIADFLSLSAEFLLVVLAWLCLTFRHKRFQTILTMFKEIEETSRTIEIRQDFQKIFRSIKVHTIIVNIIWGILYVCDHVFLSDNETFRIQVWLPFNLPRVVSHNIVLMFVDVLWIIDKFFCSLNEKVCNYSKKVNDRLLIHRVSRRTLKNGSLQPLVRPSPLEVYGQMHSDLVTLTRMIIDFFSLSITLVLIVHLILMASDLYILMLMTRNQDFLAWKQIAIFAELCCWWCLHFTESVSVIALSDETANEANRTGRALHIMLATNPTENDAESAQILSLRLLQRYLNVELYGFEVRLHVVHKIIGMVMTYVTIMMQLDIQNREYQEMQKRMIEWNTSHVASTQTRNSI